MVEIRDTTSDERLGLALLLALASHALLILGVGFELEPPARVESSRRNLEIMVVRQPNPTKEAPEPDRLAQVTQDGGAAKNDPKSRPQVAALTAPSPRTEPSSQVATPPQPKPREPTPPKKPVTTVREAPVEAPRPTPEPQRKQLPTAAQLLASSRMEAARISAELDRRTEVYSKRLKRKHISASTQEYKYAAYLEAWRRKIERIGNLNYPEEAKRRKLYGNLVLTVTLRADGSVDSIRLIRSSGHKLLDDAAIRIVRLGSPFSPFPQEIREETDLLEITRTWQFLSSNRLFSGG